MLAFGDKGYIRGQRSNFRISSNLICIAILRLKLHEKSISDGPIAPKFLLLKIILNLGTYVRVSKICFLKITDVSK